jgi:hypothetical protein
VIVDTNGPGGLGGAINLYVLEGYNSGGLDPIKVMLDASTTATFTI